jgi:hypothetical protein
LPDHLQTYIIAAMPKSSPKHTAYVVGARPPLSLTDKAKSQLLNARVSTKIIDLMARVSNAKVDDTTGVTASKR